MLSCHDIIDHKNGIYAIDADYVRPRLAAIHFLVGDGRVAIIDTGTQFSLPKTLAALEHLGHGVGSVDLVILTHIHLDHAGGAGAMMNTFPKAKLVVHPRGAPHMIAPSKLMAGVEAVYGKENALRMYGTLQPIAAERIILAPEGTQLRLGSRDLLCIETPGHARHHIAILDKQSRSLFTGDTFGIAYLETNAPDYPLLFPSTTPSQFDPDALRNSIRRMLALEPEAMYLTHFSRVAPPKQLADDLLRRIDSYVDIAIRSSKSANCEEEIKSRLADFTVREARAQGCGMNDAEILAVWLPDITLNAQGLAIWAKP